MRIQPLSDIHTEFGKFALPKTDARVVVLAGDIGVGNGHLDALTRWCSDNSDQDFILIAGNHEHYHRDITEQLLEYRRWSEEIPNLHFLENDTVEIDGIRFIGCTLWTDMCKRDPLIMINVGRLMNDFHLIYQDGEKFSPDQAADTHENSVRYLQSMITEGCVVVTHHLPSFQSIHLRYAGQSVNHGYASDLEWLMIEKKPALWIHGHTHDSFNYYVEYTRVVCNPRGYVGHVINRNFKPDLVVEI